MPVPKGVKFGGRQKGTLNNSTVQLCERLNKLKCEPFHIMALTALGNLPCGVCWGKGRTNYVRTKKCKQCKEGQLLTDAGNGMMQLTECPACNGTMEVES